MGFVVEERKNHPVGSEPRPKAPDAADLRSRGRQQLVGRSLEEQQVMTAADRSTETAAALEARLQHFEDQRRELMQRVQQAKLLLATTQDPAARAEQSDEIEALERQLDWVLKRIEATKAKLAEHGGR